MKGLSIKKNEYHIRLRIYGRDHKERIGPVSRENRARAEARLRELKNQLLIAQQTGNPGAILHQLEAAQEKLTFKEVAKEYMAERQDAKPSTITSYTSILEHHLLPRFGDRDLKLITEAMVAKFQSDLAKNGSPSRCNTVMQLFRSIFSVAVRRGYCHIDPTKNVPRKQEPKPKVDPLSEDELELVFRALDPHWKPLYICLAYTGARPNELLALRWSDVDWKREELSITKGLVRGKEGLPKTAEAERTIPMLEQTRVALEELRQRKVKHSDDFIFLDKKGAPVRKHLDKYWKKALKAAGLRHRPSYQLRHTFASLCLQKGMSPGYVAKLLGHSTLEVMYRHYARFINDASKQQEQLLRQSFQRSTPKISQNNVLG